MLTWNESFGGSACHGPHIPANLASDLLVTLLQEACDIFNFKWDKNWPWIAFYLKNPLSQTVVLVFEVQVMFGYLKWHLQIEFKTFLIIKISTRERGLPVKSSRFPIKAVNLGWDQHLITKWNTLVTSKAWNSLFSIGWR
jgi:hypothetical protein